MINLLSLFNHIKKTSLLLVRGSMTVEATVVLPFFLLFFISLSSSIEMIRLHTNISLALWNVGNDLTFYGGLLSEPIRELDPTGHYGYEDDSEEIEPAYEDVEPSEEETNVGTMIMQEIGDIAISYAYVKNRIVEYLGEDYLNKSPIVNGVEGLNFLESEIFTDDGSIDVVMTYQVSPYTVLGNEVSFRMVNRYYSHLWNGYEIENESSQEDESDRTVYITEDSEVYHLRTSCTYLYLSIRAASSTNISEQRNQNGSSYSRCLLCSWGEMPATVYICSEGERYHYSRECYSLRRDYQAVNLSTVINSHRPCSRCGGD